MTPSTPTNNQANASTPSTWLGSLYIFKHSEKATLPFEQERYCFVTQQCIRFCPFAYVHKTS